LKVTSESAKTENTSCTLDKAILTDTQLAKLEIEPKQTLLHPWARKPSIILVAAAPGVGKTWMALSIVDALTAGGSFGPWKVETTVPCLYVDGEMVTQDIQERVRALGIKDRKQPLYIYMAARVKIPPHLWCSFR
jgi:predicted ATP-dependent serine protease